ncbi:MAG: helix-turn-helix domain-containing protein [Sphingomonadales bacterium]|nr:MAG: helix-turn-helix domain-containing protein [Sphingomonadales bacterium]
MLGSPSDRTLKKTKGKIELSPLAVVGGEIGKARKGRRMSTLRVSQITRIPERYVQCIEAGDFASLPGKPFVFGFTRTICALLALDADPYIKVIKAEMYESCNDEPGIQPSPINPVAVLRRLGIGRRTG